jgi:predicted Zn-dependent protease with MMP-like domain
VDPELRDYFDQQLDKVMHRLPSSIHELIEEVPLHVEDYPSAEMMESLGVLHREELCGLYTGVPLSDRRVDQAGRLPDVVTIYREGVFHLATDRRGQIHEDELRRQIHITVLHEIGHHFGLDEDDLAELGYA